MINVQKLEKINFREEKINHKAEIEFEQDQIDRSWLLFAVCKLLDY